MIRLGITGTDTGVGKTLVATALVWLLRRKGLRIAAMKPIETGGGDDAVRLWHVAGANDPQDDVCPIRFDEPVAPMVAAAREGRSVDVALLDAAFGRLATDRDAIVVEGAGGLLVPITPSLAFDGLFRRWDLDIIVVAGNRLGVINHTLLTLRAARDAGLTVRAVVLSTLKRDDPDLAEQTNLDTLRRLVEVPIVQLPYVRSPAAAASAFEPLAAALAAGLPVTFSSTV
jgi:dethiobiotin synthetase